MDNSEEQFQELLAQVVVRTNRMLKEADTMLPFGVALGSNDQIETIITVDREGGLKDELNFIQEQLKERASKQTITACSMTYPDYDSGVVVSFLENIENYCLRANMPVVTKNYPEVELSNIETEDGCMFIFPEYDGS